MYAWDDRAFLMGHSLGGLLCARRQEGTARIGNEIKGGHRANERRRLDPFSFSARQTEIKINRLCALLVPLTKLDSRLPRHD